MGILPGISGFLHSQTALWNFFYVILGFHRGNEILVFVIEIRRFVDTGKGTGGAVKQKESGRGLREREGGREGGREKERERTGYREVIITDK